MHITKDRGGIAILLIVSIIASTGLAVTAIKSIPGLTLVLASTEEEQTREEDDESQQEEDGAAAVSSVSIVSGAPSLADNAYSPNPVNVDAGNNVTWTNNDIQVHTVTSGNGPTDPSLGQDFDSGLTTLQPGKTFSHIFDSAGEFSYFCQIHPVMVGQVVVRDILQTDESATSDNGEIGGEEEQESNGY
jgi:plastocyanin